MKNELICLSVPNFAGNEKKYVDEAVDDAWVSTAGAFITKFEQSMAAYLNVSTACACQSGTAGLHLCLRHYGVTSDDIVLVPTLTFIATINAVMYQQAQPIFFDCDDHLCMDVNQVEAYLKKECRIVLDHTVDVKSGKTVKAIIPVHVFGDHCNMKRLMELAEEYHLYVIEDATESLGGVFTQEPYQAQHTGTVGHAGVFSFNGNKIITTGGGGMIVARNSEDVQHMRYLSQQAKDDVLYFVHNEYGYNYRMTNLQAALGLAQLEKLEAFVDIKRRNYHEYEKRLAGCTYAKLMPFGAGESSNRWFYSFMLNEPDEAKRDRLIHYMLDQQIQVRPIWMLNHLQKPFQQFPSMDCSHAIRYYNSIINIPCSTNLTDEQIQRVCEALLAFQ